MRKLIAILICALALSACGQKKLKPTGGVASNAPDGKGLSLGVEWIKYKKATLDMNITLTNGYSQAVTFNRSAWKLTYNGEMGRVGLNGFMGDIATGGSESGVVSFIFPDKVAKKGHGVLTLEPIILEATDSTPQANAAPLKYEFDL